MPAARGPVPRACHIGADAQCADWSRPPRRQKIGPTATTATTMPAAPTMPPRPHQKPPDAPKRRSLPRLRQRRQIGAWCVYGVNGVRCMPPESKIDHGLNPVVFDAPRGNFHASRRQLVAATPIDAGSRSDRRRQHRSPARPRRQRTTSRQRRQQIGAQLVAATPMPAARDLEAAPAADRRPAGRGHDDAGSADAQHAGRRSERRRRADWPRPPRRQCKAMQGNARKLHKPTDADAGRSAHARARQRQQKIGPTPARRLVAAPRRQR